VTTGRDSTVLVLGAYGQVGRVVVTELRARTGLAIRAAGRDEERLRALCPPGDERVRTLRLDLADRAVLRRACEAAGVVINCVGPYLEHGEGAARAALQAGAAYIDVASEQEHFRRLMRLDAEARGQHVAIVTGAGLYPGVSGLLLAALRSAHPDASRGELLLAMGRSTAEDVGTAELMSALYELGHPLEVLRNGRLQPFEPGGERVRRILPAPFGATDLIAWPQLEILAAARSDGLADLTSGLAMAGLRPVPPAALRVLRRLDLERRPWLRRLLRRTAAWLHRRAYHSDEGRRLGSATLVAAEVGPARGGHRSSLAVADGALATAWLPVLLAERFHRGGVREGVSIPMDLLALDELLAFLASIDARYELRTDEARAERSTPAPS